jgi:nitric oxide reductase NorQ protein
LNALADHRRQLFIDKTNEVLKAPAHFMLVVSYNPGYQSVMRDLKESIKQRFVAVRFDYPAIELEQQIIVSESGCPSALALALAHFGASSRKLAGSGLFEGVSTRMLIHAAKMLATSREQSHLLEAALIDPVTDEPNIRASLLALLPLVIAAI